MRTILWILVALGALAGGAVLVLGVLFSNSAPQQAAAAAVACALVACPYGLARAWDEVAGRPELHVASERAPLLPAAPPAPASPARVATLRRRLVAAAVTAVVLLGIGAALYFYGSHLVELPTSDAAAAAGRWCIDAGALALAGGVVAALLALVSLLAWSSASASRQRLA